LAQGAPIPVLFVCDPLHHRLLPMASHGYPTSGRPSSFRSGVSFVCAHESLGKRDGDQHNTGLRCECVQVYSKMAKEWVEATVSSRPDSAHLVVQYNLVDGLACQKKLNINSSELRLDGGIRNGFPALLRHKPGSTHIRVLVTGGTGLLGRPLVRELCQHGFIVHTISSKSFKDLHPEIQHCFGKYVETRTLTHHNLDLSVDVGSDNSKGLLGLLKEGQFDVVMNLAAERGSKMLDTGKRKLNNVVLNTLLPEKLGEFADHMNFHLIHISTEYVFSGQHNDDYGYPPISVVDDENVKRWAPGNTQNPYALEKWEAEYQLRDCRQCTIVRVPVLYGHMIHGLEDGTACDSIQNYLKKNDWKHDTWQKRYPTDCEDVAYMLSQLTIMYLTFGLESKIYHYGGQKSKSKFKFMELFKETMGLDRQIQPEDKGEVPKDKRPPKDVKLNISHFRTEFVRKMGMSKWREPTEMNHDVVSKIWGPHFFDQLPGHKTGRDVR